jgi:WD40 repeat protein
MFQPYVDGMAFSPDGKTLASLGSGTICLREVATGKQRWRAETTRLRSYSPAWSLLSFSSDGKLLALGCPDKTLRLWDVASGLEQPRLTLSFQPVVVQYAPDGRYLALAGYGNTVHVLDRKGQKPPAPWGNFKTVTALAYSRDGKTLTVIGHEKAGAKAWSCARFSVPGGLLLGQKEIATGPAFALALSPDGRFFAVAAVDGNMVRLYDPATGKVIRRMQGEADSPVKLAFSVNGQALTATSQDGVARVWDTATGKMRHRFPTALGQTNNAALSADGKLLALSGRADQTLRLYDLSGAVPRPALASHAGHRSGALTVAFASGGKVVVTMSRDFVKTQPVRGWSNWSLRRWQPDTGRQLAVTERDPGGEVHWTAFSPGGRLAAVVTHDGLLRLWDVNAGKELRKWKTPTRDTIHRLGDKVWKYPRPAINDPIFSADGKILLATEGTLVHRWDVSTAKPLSTIRDWEKIEENAAPRPRRLAVAWTRCFPSPDGQTLLLAGWTGGSTRLVFARTASGARLRELPLEQVLAINLALSPDGSTLALPADLRAKPTAVRLVEAASGLERARLVGALSFVDALAFSPDGRWLACSGRPDFAVHVWHLATGREVGRFNGHQMGVTSLAFSPDGSLLASAGWENTALVWDLSRLAGRRPAGTVKRSRGELDGLWGELAGADSAAAFRAIYRLAEAPKQTVGFLRTRLRSPFRPDPKRIRQFVAQLDDNEFAKREQASEELKKLGQAAEAALEQTLEKPPSLEVRRRAEALLRHIKNAKDRLPSVELITLRALEVLEKAGTDEATRLVAELARGAADNRVAIAARGALQRLKKRPSEP